MRAAHLDDRGEDGFIEFVGETLDLRGMAGSGMDVKMEDKHHVGRAQCSVCSYPLSELRERGHRQPPQYGESDGSNKRYWCIQEGCERYGMKTSSRAHLESHLMEYHGMCRIPPKKRGAKPKDPSKGPMRLRDSSRLTKERSQSTEYRLKKAEDNAKLRARQKAEATYREMQEKARGIELQEPERNFLVRIFEACPDIARELGVHVDETTHQAREAAFSFVQRRCFYHVLSEMQSRFVDNALAFTDYSNGMAAWDPVCFEFDANVRKRKEATEILKRWLEYKAQVLERNRVLAGPAVIERLTKEYMDQWLEKKEARRKTTLQRIEERWGPLQQDPYVVKRMRKQVSGIGRIENGDDKKNSGFQGFHAASEPDYKDMMEENEVFDTSGHDGSPDSYDEVGYSNSKCKPEFCLRKTCSDVVSLFRLQTCRSPSCRNCSRLWIYRKTSATSDFNALAMETWDILKGSVHQHNCVLCVKNMYLTPNSWGSQESQ